MSADAEEIRDLADTVRRQGFDTLADWLEERAGGERDE